MGEAVEAVGEAWTDMKFRREMREQMVEVRGIVVFWRSFGFA